MQVSAAQKRVYDGFARYVRRNDRRPSLRELAKAIGLSTTSIYQHLCALQKKGLAENEGGMGGWRILGEKSPEQQVALARAQRDRVAELLQEVVEKELRPGTTEWLLWAEDAKTALARCKLGEPIDAD